MICNVARVPSFPHNGRNSLRSATHPAFLARTASAPSPSQDAPLVSFPAASEDAVESQRTLILARLPVDPPPRLAKSFVLPWTCLPPATASQEPLPQRLVLPLSLSPSTLRAYLEPAAVAPCTETGTSMSLRPHLPKIGRAHV